jgi:HAD superfamily hydrolase (TIGR01509 family)
MTKAIFWDNDGVLVDTERLYFLATQQVLASVGFNLTKEDYVELFLVQGKGAWHLIEAMGISATEIERLRRERGEVYTRLLANDACMISGADEVLRSLHGKYMMGIVTSSQKDHFNLIHRSTGLLQYIDFAITEGDVQRTKPDPEPYLRAIERSGYRSDECLAVEDSERGLISAKGAGLKCYVIPTDLTRSSQFAKADRVLGNIKEILTML